MNVIGRSETIRYVSPQLPSHTRGQAKTHRASRIWAPNCSRGDRDGYLTPHCWEMVGALFEDILDVLDEGTTS
jgi:hypothetical protein